MYTTKVDPRAVKETRKFNKVDLARADKARELFEQNGFSLTELFLKKISKIIWELRSGRVRLLFGAIDKDAYVVTAFVEKSQKTPMESVKLAEKRFKEY